MSSTKTKEAKSAFPRYDGDELWTTMGHLYKGGMWFKKKVYISGFNANTTVDGTDWRTNENVNSWPASRTLPSASDADNYFYLPPWVTTPLVGSTSLANLPTTGRQVLTRG